MVNLGYGELAELTPTSFPPATDTALWDLRNKACSASQGRFLLQPHQRFLRRVLSPDSPTRSVLVVHGTGTGKTCTAIQVAEEYILRPEFQDKKVLVLASAAVQETFRDQIFDMSRVRLSESGKELESKQCTGRRYLEMLQRIEQTPKNWANAETRDRLERIADRIISEFYEFSAYASFGLQVQRKEKEPDFDTWVSETFDNRLLIIDEAHNIRPRTDGSDKEKAITEFLEKVVKKAKGLVLVLLTATPMYESYTEIVTYFNLFLWNERRQLPGNALTADDFFDKNAELKAGMRDTFLTYCQDYVSFVKGDSPFSFPFRLPPPPSSLPPPTKTWLKKRYTKDLALKWLTLVESPAQGLQAEVLQKEDRAETDEEKRRLLMQPTVAVLPNDADFRTTFTRRGTQVAYTGEPFLGPATLAQYSAKFARVIQSIEAGEGIAFVYSNYVKMGAELFAMALEEHGFRPVSGPSLLANPAYKGPSKGAYALLTSSSSEKTIAKLVSQARSEKNRDGSLIRVIISSPLVAEGVDFRCVRQAHILDPWWNNSRIEQVIGRSLRTCSHTLLEPKKQNCTVYLHVVRTPDRTECYDEYTYRTKVEPKAEKIARVRSVLERAAMDCPLRVVLPPDWLSDDFKITQEQSEGHTPVEYTLKQMLPPTFLDPATPKECDPATVPAFDPEHDRPLSAILDVRDELLDVLTIRLREKSIWEKEDLLNALDPTCASMSEARQGDRRAVLLYTIQTAIDSGTRFQDTFDRQSILESRGTLYALRPLLDKTGEPLGIRARTMRQPKGLDKPLPKVEAEALPTVEVAPDLLETKRAELKLPKGAETRFVDPAILNGYIFDHLLTDAERRSYLRAVPDFGDRLRVPGTDILVLGYQSYDPPELPIGEDKTRVDAWTEALALKFTEVIATGTIFASLNSDGKFTISKLEEAGAEGVARAYTPTSKTYLPTTCGTGAHPAGIMKRFAKQVDTNAVGIPENITRVSDICTYAELLAREASEEREKKCVWLTPQELSILYGDPTLKARMTAEFKKTNRSPS